MQLSTESIERPAVFISCLGTSPYRELTYAPIDPLEAQAEPTRFVQAARLSALKAKGVHLSAAYILVTEQARTRNWEDFDHSIPSSGGSVRLSGLANELKRFEIEATTEDIPRGEKLEEFWQIFDLVARLVPENADLYVDLTHGFRTLPILVLLALEYVEMVKGAMIVELTYGADQAQLDGLAPTWNLQPFLIVREWTRALSSFLNDGDTRPLARLARNPIVTLGKRLQRDMPKALRNLPRAFEQFGDALVKCHSPGIGARAAHLRGTASEARDEVGHDPQLRPLGLVLDRVVCALSEFPEEHTSKKGNLKAQRAAASWCLRYGLAMQALTFLREAFVTALAELSEHGRNQSRTDQDLLLGALERAFSNQSSGERWQAEQVEAWRQSPPVDESLWARLKPALSKLKNMRNELNHAYTNPNAPRDLPISDKDWTAAGKELTEILEGLIDCIERS